MECALISARWSRPSCGRSGPSGAPPDRGHSSPVATPCPRASPSLSAAAAATRSRLHDLSHVRAQEMRDYDGHCWTWTCTSSRIVRTEFGDDISTRRTPSSRCRSRRRPASRALDLAQVQQGGARSSSMCLRASAGERMCMPARRAVTSARAHGDCQCMAAQPCGCANSNLHVCGNDTSAAESENLASLNKFKYGKFRNVRACCDGSEHTNMRSCCDGRVVCQYGI